MNENSKNFESAGEWTFTQQPVSQVERKFIYPAKSINFESAGEWAFTQQPVCQVEKTLIYQTVSQVERTAQLPISQYPR